jgi:hypothetical protein
MAIPQSGMSHRLDSTIIGEPAPGHPGAMARLGPVGPTMGVKGLGQIVVSSLSPGPPAGLKT